MSPPPAGRPAGSVAGRSAPGWPASGSGIGRIAKRTTRDLSVALGRNESVCQLLSNAAPERTCELYRRIADRRISSAQRLLKLLF